VSDLRFGDILAVGETEPMDDRRWMVIGPNDTVKTDIDGRAFVERGIWTICVTSKFNSVIPWSAWQAQQFLVVERGPE